MPTPPETAEERALVEAYAHLRRDVTAASRRDALVKAMEPIIWGVMHGNGISKDDPDAQYVVPRQGFKILRHLERIGCPELAKPLYHLVRRATKLSGVGDYGRIRARRARQREIALAAKPVVAEQMPDRQAAVAPDARLMRGLDPERKAQLLACVAQLGAKQRWFIEQHYLHERPVPDLIDDLFQRALNDEPDGPTAVSEARRAVLRKRAGQNIYAYKRNALPQLRARFLSLSEEDR